MKYIKNNRYYYQLGLVFLILNCLFSAGSFVALHTVQQKFHPVLLLFYSFGITSLFCLCTFFKKFSEQKVLLQANALLVLKLNLVNVVTWMLTFYCMKQLDPAEVCAIAFGIMPLVALFLSKRHQLAVINVFDAIMGVVMAGLVLSFSAYILFENAYSLKTVVVLIMTAMLAVSTTLSTVYAKLLNNQGISSEVVLTVRFWLLILVSAILIAFQHGLSFRLVSFEEIKTVLLITAVSALIPMYCFQKAVQYCNPVAIAFIIPFVPILTLFFEYFTPSIHFSTAKIIFVFAFTFCILLSSMRKFLGK